MKDKKVIKSYCFSTCSSCKPHRVRVRVGSSHIALFFFLSESFQWSSTVLFLQTLVMLTEQEAIRWVKVVKVLQVAQADHFVAKADVDES